MKRACSWGAALALLVGTLSAPGGGRLGAMGRQGGVAQGPSGLWRDVNLLVTGELPMARRFAGNRFRLMALDTARLDAILAAAPREFSAEARAADFRIDLPWPDGGTRVFRIEDSPVMDPGLVLQYPELKTYRGQGIDDPTASLRFDWTPSGFHAMVLSADGTVFVDPFQPGDRDNYLVYFRRDYQRPNDSQFRCGVSPEEAASLINRRDAGPFDMQVAHGTQLRTYRLAMAATAEYTAFYGGTVLGAMNGIVTTINRVNSIYERDLAVRLSLVSGNGAIVYTDPAADPYTNNDGPTMLCQNAANVDAVIGAANYDVGHVFSTGGGGIAGLSNVCSSSTVACGIGSSKARGVTGLSSPIGDAFDVDFVAHEIGHQFGGHHTFNGTTGNCGGGNRNGGTAYEPGSGSTIQAYAGICGSEDLQPHSDAYFHAGSQQEMITFITAGGGSVCPVATATGNTVPTVNAGADFTIPQGTPFTLTASGSDANGDSLTFAWEEFDLGTASPPATDNGSRPLFRSFLPAASPSRTFPKLSSIINNSSSLGETLPATTRVMTFRVTVRDNRSGGGGTASDDMVLSVNASSGPFLVTQPNTAVSWAAGTSQTVTWDVANTTAAPVSAATVKISLSTDGGLTYPTVLAASTPNDGSEPITVPGTTTSQARVKVEAVGNVFFDISNANFTITPGGSPLIVAATTAIIGESLPPNGVLDPGETVTVNFQLKNDGGAATSNLDATLQATGGVLSPSGSANFGVIAGGGGTAVRAFAFRADPMLACGATVTATLQLQDGAANLGTVSFSFVMGATVPSFAENFDGVAAPSLPGGWSAVNAQGAAPLWATTTSSPDAGPNAMFVDDPGSVTDKRLDAPSIAIVSPAAQVSFRNSFSMESNFDGGVLEVSINGGVFADILSAGGSFASGGYTGTLSGGTQNPIGARQAWTGNSGGYITTVVNLPASAAGQSVKLRWRMGSDSSVSGAGWRIDTVIVQDAVCAAGAGDFIRNGTFSSGGGMDNWLTFALPDASGMTSDVTNGVFQFVRNGPQAVVLQETGVSLGANTAVHATFQIGNSSTVRKRISVLVHDSTFADLSVCTFFLEPNTPLTSYAMQTHTTQAWGNATISFYAATVGSDGGFYLLDNVSLRHTAGGPGDQTDCFVPNPPVTDPIGPGLLGNGDFNAGTLAPWGTFGQITHQIAGGVFEFFRPAGVPSGVVLQATGEVMTAGQVLSSTFELGNSSPVRKRVTVILHDNDFSDLTACTFFIPPGQPLMPYAYQTYTTRPWTNATISFYPSTVGTEQWIRLDNVTLQRGSATAVTGTHCIEPNSSLRPVALGPGSSGRTPKRQP